MIMEDSFKTAYVPDNLRMYVHAICFKALYTNELNEIEENFRALYGRNATHKLRDLEKVARWNSFIPLVNAIGLDLEICVDGIFAEFENL